MNSELQNTKQSDSQMLLAKDPIRAKSSENRIYIIMANCEVVKMIASLVKIGHIVMV